jgi:predicted TIM-barrel fold metal-dependent hydrolase
MVRAIDVHIHPPGPTGESLTSSEEAQRYFKVGKPPASVEEMAEYYAGLDIFGIVFDIDAESVSGRPPTPNDYIADIAKKYPMQFAAFGSVDPWKGRGAVREVSRCAEDLGMIGLKFMPNMQEFFPNDRRFYPIWERAQELGLVVLIHSGTTGVGAGTPGGGGYKLKYSRPIPYIDDVAADFPGLNIIMAHPAWPWQDEQLAMLVHKPNLYMDLSGWSPKYFQPSLVQYANTLIQDKVLFGSDYPVMNPERWLADFETAGFKDDVREKILKGNAAKLLGLEGML